MFRNFRIQFDIGAEGILLKHTLRYITLYAHRNTYTVQCTYLQFQI